MWDTPIERQGKWLRANRPETHGTYPSETAPNLSNLKVYGCRAYPLTREALQGMQKRHLKTNAHIDIGYLAGYKSSTQYVIWVPRLKRCIVMSHVTFDERITYRDAPPTPEPAPLLSADLPELYDSSRTSHAGCEIIEVTEDSDQEDIPRPQQNTALTPDAAPTVGGEELGGEQAHEQGKHDHDSNRKQVRFLTPDSEASDLPQTSLEAIIINTDPETTPVAALDDAQEPEAANTDPETIPEAAHDLATAPEAAHEPVLHPETAQEAPQAPRRSTRLSRPSRKAQENDEARRKHGDKALGRIHTTIIE